MAVKTYEGLLRENLLLRNIVFGFNQHLLTMQADCMAYLEPTNTKCGKDWFINRMVYHLDGPAQRRIQEKLYQAGMLKK